MSQNEKWQGLNFLVKPQDQKLVVIDGNYQRLVVIDGNWIKNNFMKIEK